MCEHVLSQNNLLQKYAVVNLADLQHVNILKTNQNWSVVAASKITDHARENKRRIKEATYPER